VTTVFLAPAVANNNLATVWLFNG